MLELPEFPVPWHERGALDIPRMACVFGEVCDIVEYPDLEKKRGTIFW